MGKTSVIREDGLGTETGGTVSYEAFGDGDDGHEGCVKVERADEAFVDGLQAMREMLARFVEQGGDHITAEAKLLADVSPEKER